MGSTVSYSVSLGVEEVSVPDLAGPAADAEQALADARLAGAPTEAYSDSVPAGEVMSQDPAPGTSVPVGSTVSYSVSLGVEEVSVPDLAGPAADAEQALADARLAGAPTEAYSDSVPAGEVMSQDPAPGTSVPVGSTVSYSVSLGVEEVSVPDLAGPAADAEQALADARLAGAPTEAYSDSVPAGEVMSQDPAPGTSVPVGSTVSYSVSLGVEEVSVPDLAGPAADAEQALADARLAGAPTEAYSDSVPAGEVMSQVPPPARACPWAAPSATASASASKRSACPTSPVPPRTPSRPSPTRASRGAPTEAYSDSVPAGEVMSQDPAPGTSVPVGSTVSYSVSLGVEEVSVPDLAGPAADAEQALADARLAGGPDRGLQRQRPRGRGHEPGSRPRHERARGQHRQLQRQPRRRRGQRARPRRSRRGRRAGPRRRAPRGRPRPRPTATASPRARS